MVSINITMCYINKQNCICWYQQIKYCVNNNKKKLRIFYPWCKVWTNRYIYTRICKLILFTCFQHFVNDYFTVTYNQNVIISIFLPHVRYYSILYTVNLSMKISSQLFSWNNHISSTYDIGNIISWLSLQLSYENNCKDNTIKITIFQVFICIC